MHCDVLFAHECLVAIAFILGYIFQVHIHISGLYLGFALTICDTIGCGMTCSYVMMKSFMFSCESCL